MGKYIHQSFTAAARRTENFSHRQKNKIILFPPFSCRGSFKGRENKSERFSSTNLKAFLHFSSEFSKSVNFWKKNLATRFKFALTVTTI